MESVKRLSDRCRIGLESWKAELRGLRVSQPRGDDDEVCDWCDATRRLGVTMKEGNVLYVQCHPHSMVTCWDNLGGTLAAPWLDEGGKNKRE